LKVTRYFAKLSINHGYVFVAMIYVDAEIACREPQGGLGFGGVWGLDNNICTKSELTNPHLVLLLTVCAAASCR